MLDSIVPFRRHKNYLSKEPVKVASFPYDLISRWYAVDDNSTSHTKGRYNRRPIFLPYEESKTSSQMHIFSRRSRPSEVPFVELELIILSIQRKEISRINVHGTTHC